MSFVAGYDVDLVAFHLPRQDLFRWVGHDPVPQ